MVSWVGGLSLASALSGSSPNLNSLMLPKTIDHAVDPTQRAAPQTAVLTKNEVVGNKQRTSSSRKGWITGISVKPMLTQRNKTVTVSME